tara:strand:- start:744 stop:902 length:159 start_codon:yes stop_codon:yes gene_type:complete
MRAGLFIALILVALGITGNGDYEHEVAQADHYCELVRSKVWPDFNQNINCEE